MNDDPETPEIDWEAMRLASISLAEVVWSYHAALLASGFNDTAAIALTINYQEMWLRSVQR